MNAKIAAVTVLLLGLLCGGCESLNSLLVVKPTAEVTGVSFGQVSLTSAQLLFDVNVSNPYTVPMPLTNLDYTLASGVETFLSGKAALDGEIPAKSTKSLSLPVTVNYLELLKSLKTIKPGTAIPYKAGVGLSMDAPGFGLMRLPLTREGELSLPTVPGMDVNTIWNMIK